MVAVGEIGIAAQEVRKNKKMRRFDARFIEIHFHREEEESAKRT